MAQSIVTKDKFGVPIEDANGTGAGIMMPKLKYRFRVSFHAPFGGETRSTTLTQNVQSVGRPAVAYAEQEIHSYNSIVYLQGKHSWSPIDIVVRDDISNSVSKAIGAQVQRQVNHFQQTTTASANDFKFGVSVQVLDGTASNAPTEEWFLEGCFLTNVAYGDHDYSAAEAQQITLTLRFDNALQFGADGPLNGGFGDNNILGLVTSLLG
mgnify:CR=1 FL=1